MANQKLKPAIFAFLKAAESGDEEAVRKFLNEGGDVHAADDGNNTALHLVFPKPFARYPTSFALIWFCRHLIVATKA
jgi:hypothetical protein